jgi:uncharacterized membrane protein YkoI
MLAKLRPLAFAVTAAVAALPFGVWAQGHDGDGDNDHDHDLARELYERGEIHSLADVLGVVRKHNPGDIVGVALIPVGTNWVYRIQVVRADGQRTIVDVDAGTAVPIEPDGTQ